MFNQETHHWEPEGKSGHPVLEPHSDVVLPKSGQIEPKVHHQKPESEGDYPVSEPHPDLLLTKVVK